MGNPTNQQIRSMFYDRSDSKLIVKEVAKQCLKMGIKNTDITEFIQDKKTFEELDIKEQVVIIRSIYNITKLNQFNYESIFTTEDIQDTNIISDDYINQYMKLDYIGGSSDEEMSDDDKKGILRAYDEYQLNKLVMLNSKYPNKNTKVTYFTIYQTNLHYAEKVKDKDLMRFTTKEIEDLIDTLTYTYDTTRQNLITFINLYCEWCVDEKLIKKNPCERIDRTKIRNNPKIFLSSKIFGKTSFYDMLKAMEESTKLPNLVPLLLARYGIIGKSLEVMINLKWEDIDEKNMVVKVRNNNRITELPIDKQFIEYIKKAKNYTESPKDGSKNTIRYSDFGYVLKKAFAENENEKEEKTIKYATVFNRVNEACESIGIKRIAFKTLLLSRQFEILLEMRRFGRLKQSDFEKVVELFDLGEEDTTLVNRAFTLKKRWIELTGDIVVTQRKDTQNVPEGNSYKTYLNLKQDLDLSL